MKKSDMFAFVPHICMIMEQSGNYGELAQAIMALASAISTIGVTIKWILETYARKKKDGDKDGKDGD